MDWKLMATTFIAIFLAEIGDKTQLATLSLSSGSTSRWSIFLGSAAALIAASAIAVVGGEALTRVIPALWIQRAAGGLFVVMGVAMLLAKK